MYSLTAMFAGFNKNARNITRSLFMTGLVSPEPNHLEGKRRIYSAYRSAGHVMLVEAKQDPVVRKLVDAMMRQTHTAVLTMAIVDDELRVNGFLGSFQTDINNHRIGEHKYQETGIATVMVTRSGMDLEKPIYSLQLIEEPQQRLAYNPYDPEFSWSMTIDSIDSERMVHHSPYRISSNYL